MTQEVSIAEGTLPQKADQSQTNGGAMSGKAEAEPHHNPARKALDVQRDYGAWRAADATAPLSTASRRTASFAASGRDWQLHGLLNPVMAQHGCFD